MDKTEIKYPIKIVQSNSVTYGNSGILPINTKLKATYDTNKVPNKAVLPWDKEIYKQA